jgi:hypothetical protein
MHCTASAKPTARRDELLICLRPVHNMHFQRRVFSLNWFIDELQCRFWLKLCGSSHNFHKKSTCRFIQKYSIAQNKSMVENSASTAEYKTHATSPLILSGL